MGDTASVQEVTGTNFHLVGVGAVGTGRVNRLNSGSTDNPSVVSVPFGGTANSTAVTFTDAVNTGQIEICKQPRVVGDLSGATFAVHAYLAGGAGRRRRAAIFHVVAEQTIPGTSAGKIVDPKITGLDVQRLQDSRKRLNIVAEATMDRQASLLCAFVERHRKCVRNRSRRIDSRRIAVDEDAHG